MSSLELIAQTPNGHAGVTAVGRFLLLKKNMRFVYDLIALSLVVMLFLFGVMYENYT